MPIHEPFRRLSGMVPQNPLAPEPISYKTMRRIIGVLAIALPFALLAGSWATGCRHVLGSISAYYHARMRDVFVGILCALGIAFRPALVGNESPDRMVLPIRSGAVPPLNDGSGK